jgi:hypothetical protein
MDAYQSWHKVLGAKVDLSEGKSTLPLLPCSSMGAKDGSSTPLQSPFCCIWKGSRPTAVQLSDHDDTDGVRKCKLKTAHFATAPHCCIPTAPNALSMVPTSSGGRPRASSGLGPNRSQRSASHPQSGESEMRCPPAIFVLKRENRNG